MYPMKQTTHTLHYPVFEEKASGENHTDTEAFLDFIKEFNETK